MLLCIFISTSGNGKSVYQLYRQRLVPKWPILGGSTNGMVRNCVLSGEGT